MMAPPLQSSSLEINNCSDDENDEDYVNDEDEYDDEDEDFDGHVEPWNEMDVRHRRKPIHLRFGILFAVTSLFVLVVSLFVVALLSVHNGGSSHAAAAALSDSSSVAAEGPIYGKAHLSPNEYHNVRLANGYESVLVTGGLGFIGSHVVELLLHRGFRVTILDDESNGHNHNIAAVELVPKDITVITDLPTLPDNTENNQNSNNNYYYTHVVHLAAAISVSESIIDPNKYERINYGGSQKILDWIHRYNEHIIGTTSITANATTTTASSSPSTSSSSHPPLMTIRKIVAASSAAVYGDPEPTLLPLQENAPYGGLSPYADTKYRMEQLLQNFTTTTTTTTKVSATALRFFNVYGPRQDPNNPYSGVISLFLQMASSNLDITILGDGYMTRDFVYVKDVARAIVLALLQDDDKNNNNKNNNVDSKKEDVQFNVYNVCTGTSITINTLANRIKSIMKSSSKIIHTTPRIGDIRESECNPTLAKLGLGFETVFSQEYGLEKTAEWFRSLI